MKTLTDYNPVVPKVTNFEHYKDELLAIADSYDSVAVYKGKPYGCRKIDCHDCEIDCGGMETDAPLLKWGFQEYKEPVHLTKAEYHFLAAMETGYIGRDNHDHLFWFENPPSKVDGVWMNNIGDTVRLSFMKTLNLPFIKYEGTCWSVEQLLELEVKE